MVWAFLVAFVGAIRARIARGPARKSWSLSFETVVRFLREDWEKTALLPFAEVRRLAHARPYPVPLAKKVTIRDEELGGVPTRWFTPRGAADSSGPVVLFFHGGSYIFGSAKSTHADLLMRLCVVSGVSIAALEYRLVPEHPYPAQLEDAIAAFDALGAREVIVAGDSAGGNLAVALLIALRERGKANAARALLISPWVDLTMPGASFVDNDAFDYGTRDLLTKQAKAFANGLALEDPRISPALANLEGLPPLFVIAGDAELLRDDIHAFAARAKDAKVDVTLHTAPDMPHNAPVFAAYHPSAQAALDAAARFLR